MLIAPTSEPPRRVTSLRGVRSWFVGTVLVLAGGCFFELPELEPGIGGGSGSAGFAGTPPFGGSSGLGGSINPGGSAGVGGQGCPPGQKLCGESCRPLTAEFGCSTTSCESCGSAPNALIDCNGDGRCAVLGCQPGFVDCNGDTLGQTPPLSGDGCEYSLGPTAASVPNVDVPFANILVDGNREDWAGVPAYVFDQVCPNCVDNNTEVIDADGTVPPLDDLDARFRVAWNQDKFFVLVDVFDNQLYDMGVVGGGRCQVPGVCEDAVQVFFAGLEDRSHGYFNDNKRVFLGLSENFGAPAQGPPGAGDIGIRVGRQGNLCYRLEAQVDWAYITNSRNITPPPGYFPPAPGQSYGFDIALNDWDAPLADQNAIQRQSQIFWVKPGDDFADKPTGIPTMTLRDGADAGQ